MLVGKRWIVDTELCFRIPVERGNRFAKRSIPELQGTALSGQRILTKASINGVALFDHLQIMPSDQRPV